MQTDSPWDTIESDPHIFTHLLRDLGVKGTEVVELLGLDELSAPIQPGIKAVTGLIFLFKFVPNLPLSRPATSPKAAEMYFARQTAHNACATQALINLLLNKRDAVPIGPLLGEFYEMTSFLDPTTRGDAIAQHAQLRTIHNAYSPYVHIKNVLTKVAPSSADAFHFVTFFHANGALWELDGLQAGPICHAECDAENWQQKAIEVLTRRIEAISALDNNGIQFNLMAVVPERVELLQKQAVEEPMTADECTAHIQQIQSDLDEGTVEVTRRKHNYLPMINALLQTMAAEGDLRKVVEAYAENQ